MTIKVHTLNIDKLAQYYDDLWLGKEFISISFIMMIPYIVITILFHLYILWILESILFFFLITIGYMIFFYFVLPRLYTLTYLAYLNIMKLDGSSYSTYIVLNFLLIFLSLLILHETNNLNFYLALFFNIFLFFILFKPILVMKNINSKGQFILSEYWEKHLEEKEVEKISMGIPYYFLKDATNLVSFFTFLLFFLIMFFYGLILRSLLNLFSSNFDSLSSLFITLGIVLSYILIIIILNSLKKYIVHTSVSKYKERDKRKHIVYLRAFEQDKYLIKHQSNMKNFFLSLRGKTNLDSLMLEECSTIGPVIALGNPKNKVSIYGPPRYYAQNNEWKAYVHKILDEAQLVYMFLQGTNGVKWEVEQLIKLNKLKKTIFIISPKSNKKDILYYFNLITQFSFVEEEKKEIINKINKNQLIGFFIDDNNEMIIMEGVKRNWTSYLIAIRASLRLKIDSQS